MRLKSTILTLPFLVFTGSLANAALICVCANCNVTDLQAALDDALLPGDDTIRLEQDETHTGNFTYTSPGNGTLTIEGGYVGSSGNNCPDRTSDPPNSTLDGGGTGSTFTAVLTADTFRLDGLRVINGASTTGGAGLTVTTVPVPPGTQADVELVGVTFSDNTIDSTGGFVLETAGGAYVTGADEVTVRDSTFLNNIGGGAGGLRVLNVDGSDIRVTLESNLFWTNTADAALGDAGGASLDFAASGGLANGSEARLEDNIFVGNTGRGLAIVNADSAGNGVRVVRNTFDGNSATTNAGMQATVVGSIRMTDNVFVDNALTAESGPFFAGGLSISLLDDISNPGNLIFTNNTLSGNVTANSIGGLYLELEDNTRADLYNNILYGNEATTSWDELFIENTGAGTGNPPVVELLFNGFDQDDEDGWNSSAPIAIDASNLDLFEIDLATIFVDPSPSPTDLHLVAGAIVIDAGDNEAPALSSFDRDFGPRVNNCIVDMGAFESFHDEIDTDGDGCGDNIDNCTLIPNGPTSPDAGGNSQLDTDDDGFGNICDPDINSPNDCFVDFLDVIVFRSAFLSTPATPNWNADADFNGDQIVNFPDLAVFREYFFREPGPSGLVACPATG